MSETPDADVPSTRPCPSCAEQVQRAAVKCRFCGADLREKPPRKPVPVRGLLVGVGIIAVLGLATAAGMNYLAEERARVARLATAQAEARAAERAAKAEEEAEAQAARRAAEAAALAQAEATARAESQAAARAAADLAAQPYFEVLDTAATEDCARVTDYCIRVVCVVTNTGGSGGSALVRFMLSRPGKSVLSHEELTYVEAGQQIPVYYDFFEAELGDERATANCVAAVP